MKLRDYFNETTKKNETQTGGWSVYYYGVFSKVINDNNFKNVAEIGIGYGDHSRQVLQNTNIDKIYLVDPMQFYPNDAFADDIMRCEAEIPGNNFNELYGLINEKLSPWKDKYTWLRKPSLDVTNDEIKDEELDAVFVDGDHTYQAVIADLRFWWKKVRKGGMMLGDDYWMGDVARAVHEFEAEIGVKATFLTRPDKDYKIFCFTK